MAGRDLSRYRIMAIYVRMLDILSRCSDKYLRSPLYIGSKIWDLLPIDVQRADTLNQFGKAIYYIVTPNIIIY